MSIQSTLNNHKYLNICHLQYSIVKYSQYSKIKINPILATELRIDLKPLTTPKPNKPKKPKST